MDEDNAKEPEPSTSKKECQKSNSGHEIGDKRDHDDGSVNSESWSSGGSYSAKSRIDMTEVRTDGPKPPVAKRESKPRDRRKKIRGERRRRGRIEKRKRSEVQRQVVRRPLKRRPKIERRRELSVSTIFTRLSPGSTRRSRSPGCKYCGHRCCLRRYQHKAKRVRFKRIRKNKVEKRRKRTLPSECIQVGSRSVMLSPLFVNTNSTPAHNVTKQDPCYVEITPEMIYVSLRKLTMWREAVGTSDILNYLKLNYPVDSDNDRLLKELRDKLRIAVLAGIVTQITEDLWSLSTALKNRRLTRTHASMFWQLYADIMKPVYRRRIMMPLDKEEEDTQTTTTALAVEKNII